ncbi:unnamed protein product, partial [Prorocentrum cordatum]
PFYFGPLDWFVRIQGKVRLPIPNSPLPTQLARPPSMAVCGIRLLASVLLSVPLTAAARRSSHGAQGRDLQVPGEAPGVYDVHLLVTRHGLSCANIVETWVHKLDAGRRLMHDPLLGGVGIHGCSEGRTAVEAYLHNRSLPPYDAVVSSVLARAMETALLTYPQQAAPLYVVPFIREHAAGLSNAPKEPVEQLADLNASVPYDFRVDYRWVEEFGSQKGSWDQFLHFLEQSFLPDLVSRLGKPPGSKIVLPVVTHSLFMRDSDVGEKCKAAFGENPSGKPLNNQVVEMTYAFHSGEAAVLRAEPGQDRRPPCCSPFRSAESPAPWGTGGRRERTRAVPPMPGCGARPRRPPVERGRGGLAARDGLGARRHGAVRVRGFRAPAARDPLEDCQRLLRAPGCQGAGAQDCLERRQA